MKRQKQWSPDLVLSHLARHKELFVHKRKWGNAHLRAICRRMLKSGALKEARQDRDYVWYAYNEQQKQKE